MTDVKIFEEEIRLLGEEEEVMPALKEAAEEIASRVSAPKHLTIRTRSGRGPRGAFSQVIMSGRGAIAIEFGSKTMRASAPLRNALGGG